MAKFPVIGGLLRFFIINFDVYKDKKDKNLQAKIEKIYKEDQISLDEYNSIVHDIILNFFQKTLLLNDSRIEIIVPIVEEYLSFYRKVISSISVYSLSQEQLRFILYKDFLLPIIAKSLIIIMKNNIPSFIDKVLNGKNNLVSNGIDFLIDEKILDIKIPDKNESDLIKYINDEHKQQLKERQSVISMQKLEEISTKKSYSNTRFFLILFKLLAHIYKDIEKFDENISELLKKHLIELVAIETNDYVEEECICKYVKEEKYLNSEVYSDYLVLHSFNILKIHAIFSDKLGRRKNVFFEEDRCLKRYKEHFSSYYINSDKFFSNIDYFLPIKYFEKSSYDEYSEKRKYCLKLNNISAGHCLLELHNIVCIKKEKTIEDEKLADTIVSNIPNEGLSLLDKLALSRYYALKNNFKEARKYYKYVLIEGKNSLGEEYINVIKEGIRAEAENSRLKKVDLDIGSSVFRKYYIYAVYAGLWKFNPKKQSKYLLFKLKNDVDTYFVFFPSINKGKNRRVNNITLDLKNPLVHDYMDVPIPQLFYFAREGNLSNVKKILKNNADLDYIEPIYQANILFFTLEHKKVLNYLVPKLKLDTLNKKLKNNEFILLHFINHRHIKLVVKLLNRGVDIDENIIYHIINLIHINDMTYDDFNQLGMFAKKNKNYMPEKNKLNFIEKFSFYSRETLLLEEDKNDFFEALITMELNEKEFNNYKNRQIISKDECYQILDLIDIQGKIDLSKDKYIAIARQYKNQELEEYLVHKFIRKPHSK